MMKKYNLEIKKSAAKELEKLPKKTREVIFDKIKNLAENPFPSQSQKLTDKEQYRLRVGRYRVLYEIKKEKIIIIVVKVAHRKNIYKKNK